VPNSVHEKQGKGVEKIQKPLHLNRSYSKAKTHGNKETRQGCTTHQYSRKYKKQKSRQAKLS
jgi:uncharacterized protein YoaH (UPF0181 family)